ncbi:hypothetical protein [Alkalihalobacterium alkalinitrilicum]|uniref:hypothetical protein n=1 Tax=Alkalihalobacterium alkalinitrilicum TaxID=427920 RepID=UPI00099502EA|nr:hypothetical protein [Alkalihalobacterium alkalinitrilicum]
MTTKYALHETLELHELLTFKNLCLTKSSTMSSLVECEELKAILTMDVTTGKQHVQQLQGLLQNGGPNL